MAQRLGPALLEQVPRVDLVVGPDGYRELPELIGWPQRASGVSDTEFDPGSTTRTCPPVREKGPNACVPVQRGCDYRCTFCIVPYTRGPGAQPEAGGRRARSRRGRGRGHDRGHAARPDGQLVPRRRSTTSPTCCARSARWTGSGGCASRARIRTTSSPRVIEAMAETPAVCEHVHLPMQSGSNAVLKRMLRRYTREGYLEVVARASRGHPRHRAHDRHHRRLSRARPRPSSRRR